MEDTVRARQGDNPEFSFLKGGDGAAFYSNMVAGRNPDEVRSSSSQHTPLFRNARS